MFGQAEDTIQNGVTCDRIGKLAAIAVIRTALNYFLSREVSDERAEEQREGRRRGGTAAVDGA